MLARWLPALGFALASSGCGPGPDVADPRVVHGTLTIDGEFSEVQRAEIRAAIALWTEASGGTFSPRVEVGEVRCGQAFAVEAVHDVGCRVGQPVRADDDRELRVWGSTSPRRRSVAVVTWLEGDDFRYNVAHELGHYLLVGHGKGLMAQARFRQEPVISLESIQELCAIWGCEVPDALD